MRFTPVPLPSGLYADNARPWTGQEWVNWLPTKAERPGARSDLIGRDPPGLRPFSVVGTGPIRGAHNAEGSLFIVSGTGLYRINPLGVASSLGTIPGVGRVSIAHNQVTGGNQVIVANGSAAYVYNTADDSFAQVTDEGFPGAKSVAFLGQMILYVEPFGRFWGHSDLADATSYNTINRYEAESSPDLIQAVLASQGEALVFGKKTIDVYANVVTENASFQRTTVIERGAASGHAIVTLDNSCIFLGDDGIVYRLNGYTPAPISHRPLEFGLAEYDLSKAFAYVWEDRGYKVVYFSVPGGKTWGYDVAQGEWHRRESYGLDRWRLNTLTPFVRKWIGGDFADGTLWELDWDYHKEGCDELVRICRPPIMHDGGNRARVHGMRFDVDMGDRGVDPEATITGALGDGPAGEVVSYQYTISGYVEGDEVSAIAVTSGALPEGLSISSTGLVTGTREDVGEYTFTISGTDRCGNAVTFTDTSETTGFTISGDVLTGYSGAAHTGTYTNTNGFGAITYVVLSGTFPAGLTLASDGTWSGTRTTVGSYSWVVQATDAAGNTATVNDAADILETDFWILEYASGITVPKSVVVIDGTTQTVDGTLTPGVGTSRNPVMSPDHDTVYVSDWGSNSVSIIDVVSRTITGTVSVVEPRGICVDSDYLYVVCGDDGTLRKYDRNNNHSLALSVAIPGFDMDEALWLALVPDGRLLAYGGSTLGAFNSGDLSHITDVSLGSGMEHLRANPNGSAAYICQEASSLLHVIDLSDYSTSTVAVSFCSDVQCSPDGSKVYALSNGAGQIREYNASGMTFVRTFGVSGNGLAISGSGATACVTKNPNGGNIATLVNIATGTATNLTVTTASEDVVGRALP